MRRAVWLTLIVLVVASIACETSGSERQPTYTPLPTYTPYPTYTPGLAPSDTPKPTNTARPTDTASPTETPAQARVEAEVVEVVDGDTIKVEIEGSVESLRYIGIDCPEPDQWYGPEAAEANRQLVEGQMVYLEGDVSDRDRYDRLLRYVFLADGTFVNEELVRLGYAWSMPYPPDTRYQDRLDEAEAEAKEHGRGLHATPTPVPTATPTAIPTPIPTAVPTAPPTAVPPSPTSTPNCHPSYPDVCIPPPPPDLDCGQIRFRRFKVLPPDPHGFDGDHDGIGCESG